MSGGGMLYACRHSGRWLISETPTGARSVWSGDIDSLALYAKAAGYAGIQVLP